MTTFLLHGGKTSREDRSNRNFFRQLTALVGKQHVSILLCYWSRQRNLWDELAERDISKIRKETEKSVEFYVVEDTSDLFAQLPRSDVLYVAGGDAELIEPYYEKMSALGKEMEGKIYAGSSMGAFLVSQQYVLSFDSQDSSSVHKGLGILPIQVLCHWDIETRKQEKLELLHSSLDIPIVTIDESEFVTIHQ